ncbi:MAG TPA: hypothetical protein VEI04_04870 [Syntrophobacteria bacterium]|nr:hypothetical protein [Syntrophobacteria bacterium]
MVRRVLKSVVSLFLVVGSLLFVGLPAGAGEGERNALSPYFSVDDGDPAVDSLPLKATEVRVAINGVIADVVIRSGMRTKASDPSMRAISSLHSRGRRRRG